MKKVVESKIQSLVDSADYKTFHRVFGNTCVMVAKLRNGFTLVGTTSTTNPKMYSEQLTERKAKKAIKAQVWKLEAYLIKVEEYELVKLKNKRQHLKGKYRGLVTEISNENNTDEHAFWLEQELIGVGMEMEELEEEISNLG